MVSQKGNDVIPRNKKRSAREAIRGITIRKYIELHAAECSGNRYRLMN